MPGNERRMNEISQKEYAENKESIKQQVLGYIKASNQPVSYRDLMVALTGLNPDWISSALEELIMEKRIKRKMTRKKVTLRDSFFE